MQEPGQPSQVGRIGLDDIWTCDPGLESQGWALNGRIYKIRSHFSQDFSDVFRVLGPLFGSPVRLIDLFLDHGIFERAIGKGIHRIKIHVVFRQKGLQLRALVRRFDQRIR